MRIKLNMEGEPLDYLYIQYVSRLFVGYLGLQNLNIPQNIYSLIYLFFCLEAGC
jgi:hypothetical protein